MCNTYFEGQGLLPCDLSVIWGYLGILGAALLLVNLLTVKSMSDAVELNTTCEAAYKYFHSRGRVHAEAIAFYSAEVVEVAGASRCCDEVARSSQTLSGTENCMRATPKESKTLRYV